MEHLNPVDQARQLAAEVSTEGYEDLGSALV